jgi:multidrug transporter EmrE-like cation transporter
MSFSKTYAFQLLLDLDLSVGYAIWRQRGITISSQVGLKLRGTSAPWWAVGLGWFLNFIQTGHCEMAIVDDIAGLKASLEILGG